ncbi:hypothetical protein [Microbacterium sp.]|uniref:hypothetical protein n=1 Tax=Microbacterium sp. TaxID=51671 RepID=UPI003A8FA9FE
MPENFATAWDVKSSQTISVERSADGSGNVVVMVMDYDDPDTAQIVKLSASAAARVAAVMAPDRENGSER